MKWQGSQCPRLFQDAPGLMVKQPRRLPCPPSHGALPVLAQQSWEQGPAPWDTQLGNRSWCPSFQLPLRAAHSGEDQLAQHELEQKWAVPSKPCEMGKGQSPPLQLLEGHLHQRLHIPPSGRARRDRVLALVRFSGNKAVHFNATKGFTSKPESCPSATTLPRAGAGSLQAQKNKSHLLLAWSLYSSPTLQPCPQMRAESHIPSTFDSLGSTQPLGISTQIRAQGMCCQGTIQCFLPGSTLAGWMDSRLEVLMLQFPQHLLDLTLDS